MSEIRTIPPQLTKNEWNALLDHALEKPASYIIRNSNGTIQAINGSTGKIDYSGTDASTVIQSAINATNKGVIFLKEMDVNIGTSTINVTDKEILIVGSGMDTTIIRGSGDYIMKFERTVAYDVFMGLQKVKLVQNNDNGDCLVLRKVTWSHFSDILTDGGRRGLSLEGAIGNLFINIYVWGAKASFTEPLTGGGIFLTGYGVEYANENRFIGGRVSGCLGDGIVGTYGINDYFQMDIEANNVGFRAYTGFSNWILNQCWFEANTAQAIFIVAAGTYGGKISNCVISVPSNAEGIQTRQSDVEIADNWFTGSGTYYIEGINLSAPKKLRIVKNIGLTTAKLSGVSGATFVDNTDFVTENSGTATFSGNGTQTAFTIAHGLASTPKMAIVTAGSSDAKGDFYVTYDATNITVTYATAPPTGTNNVILGWYAEI